MIGEEFPFFLHVSLVGGCGIHVEVVAPAGKFKTIVAHFISKWSEFYERKVGPLAGKKCDGS
jgi:hypothetical protein